jgi:amyloid beta precursor protein binding protein 1
MLNALKFGAGVGKFTIADDAVVDEKDLGVNFFLDDGSLGRSRSQRCSELLQELNPDVQGDWFPRGEVRELNSICPSITPKHVLT